MLEKIRNDVAHNQFVRALLIFTTLAFVAWGVGFSSLSLFTKNYAIKAGSVEVSAEDYYKSYLQAKNAIAQQIKNIPPEYLQMAGIDLSDEAIKQRVNNNFRLRILLDNAAKDNKIFISSKTVLNMLAQNKDFQKDGKFDAETYKSLLKNANLRPIAYEKDIAERISYSLITQSFNNSVFVSDFELDSYAKYKQERRDAKFITVTAKDVASKLPKATDEEIQSIYNEHKDLYVVPEKRSFNLLAISKNNINQNVSVSKEEIANYYNDNKDLYMTKRKFNVKQILVADQEDADKLLSKTDLNVNFTKYVKEFSTDEISKQKNGDMGWITADIFSEEITDILNTTPKGKVSTKAAKSPFGLHIFKIVDIKDPTQKSLKEVEEKVIASIKSEKIDNLLREKTDTAIDLVSAGEKLSTVSEQIGVKLKSIDLAKETDSAKYTPAVFSTELNEVSESIDLDYDSIGFVEVTNIEEEYIKPLEEVKNKVKAIFLQEKSKEILETTSQEILNDINENKITFTQAAKKYKLVTPIKTVVSLNRENNRAKGVQQEIAKEIFNTEVNSVSEKILPNNAGLVITKVIDSYQEKLSAENRDKLKQTLQTEKSSDFYEAFLNDLERQYPIKMNIPLINSVVAQANSAIK